MAKKHTSEGDEQVRWCSGQSYRDIVLATNIDDLELSDRTYKSLKLAGIHTVLDLTRCTEEDVLQMKCMCQRCFEEIVQKLAFLGVSLSNPDEENT